MAQNITLLNASYSDVPAVTLPKTGGGTAKFTDVTPTTATDADVASGKIYFKADGTQSTGTASGGGGNYQAKTNIDPTTSSQTITPDNGYDALSSVQINAMPSGSAGTPTASKGTVTNHSVSITPSVTNSTGYITGGTKTGTGVTVSASELVSGTKSITANGTGIDVTEYAAVDVAVPGDENYIIYLVWNGSLDRWQVNKTFAQWKSAYNDGKVILLQPQDQLPRELCDWRYDSTDDVFYYYIAEYSSGDYVKYYIYTYGTGDVITEISRETDYNTSSADALSGHVLSGKGFFNSTGYHTGSIVTKTSSDLTANNLTVTAPAGYYENSASKTLTDANLTAGNIKKDVTIFGTTGTYEGSASPNIQALSITQNGTYTASGGVDGYSPVTVNVSGGGGSVEPKQINFIDYDGTILYAYTKAEINAMTSESDLPANPSHTGLTAQGWNWTLAQIKAQLTAMPDADVWVGQMYITQSGNTEIDVSMPKGRLSPILAICVNGTVTVDWGDNTTPDTVTGTSLTTRKDVPHTYASEGDYTISIHAVSGGYSFYSSSTYLILRKDTVANNSQVYASCIQNVRVGSGITSIDRYAFYYCYSLASITIPSTVTSIGRHAFYYCYSLASITIPSTVTSIGRYAFYGCLSLASITIPSTVTSIETYALQNCDSLASITIPSTVTSIGTYAFQNCYSLASITIPSTVTSIENGVFSGCCSLASITIPSTVTSIGANPFSGCPSLASITIPSTVTSIGANAFQNCYGIAEYHILPTTVPTGGTTMFSGIVSDCIIYVPSAKLNDYKTASNWSTYASYMVGE